MPRIEISPVLFTTMLMETAESSRLELLEQYGGMSNFSSVLLHLSTWVPQASFVLAMVAVLSS